MAKKKPRDSGRNGALGAPLACASLCLALLACAQPELPAVEKSCHEVALLNEIPPDDTNQPFVALIAPLTAEGSEDENDTVGASSAGLGISLATGVCAAFARELRRPGAHSLNADVELAPPLKLVILDDSVKNLDADANTCQPKKPCSSRGWATQVTKSRNAIAIIGSIDSARTQRIQNVVRQGSGPESAIPVINAASTLTALSDPQYPFFRLGLPDSKMARAIVAHYRNLANGGELSILTLTVSDDPNTDLWTSGLTQDLKAECGGRCKVDTIRLSEEPVAQLQWQMAKHSGKGKFLAIGILSMSPNAYRIVKAASDTITMADRGHIELFGTTSNATREFPRRVGDDMAKSVTVFAAFGGEGDSSPVALNFRKRFKARVGMAPDTYSAQGYDAGLVVLTAYQNNLSRQPWTGRNPAYAQRIADIDIDGVLGSLSFRPDHQRPLQVGVKRWSRNRLLPCDWYDAVNMPPWLMTLVRPWTIGVIATLLLFPFVSMRTLGAFLLSAYAIARASFDPWLFSKVQTINEESIGVAWDLALEAVTGFVIAYGVVSVAICAWVFCSPDAGKTWLKPWWFRAPWMLCLRIRGFRRRFYREVQQSTDTARDGGRHARPDAWSCFVDLMATQLTGADGRRILIDGCVGAGKSSVLRQVAKKVSAEGAVLAIWCHGLGSDLLEEIRLVLGRHHVDDELLFWHLRLGHVLLILDPLVQGALPPASVNVIRRAKRVVAARHPLAPVDHVTEHVWTTHSLPSPMHDRPGGARSVRRGVPQVEQCADRSVAGDFHLVDSDELVHRRRAALPELAEAKCQSTGAERPSNRAATRGRQRRHRQH